MLFDLPRPVVFAHRGARAYAPENTLASFELAVSQGADAIELDARLTADGHIVVFHDRMLGRTTNGTGRVTQKTLAELRDLDAGSSFSEKFRGEKIPLLEEVVKCGMEGRILFSSFSASNLKRSRELLPGVPRGLLAYPHLAGVWARSFGFSFGDYAALHPSVGDVDAQAVQRVHRLRRRIHVWTVNQPADMRHLSSWGADGIITDDPALALQVLGRST